MTFDRLSSTTLGSNYVLVLGLKITTVSLMFYFIRAQRKASSIKGSHKYKTGIKTLPARLLSSYNLIIILGLLAFLLSDLLYHIYMNTLNGQKGRVAVKKSLLDILNCPTCKGHLDLEITEQRSDEILTGHLTCTLCNELFPITDSIPNFLPESLRNKL